MIKYSVYDIHGNLIDSIECYDFDVTVYGVAKFYNSQGRIYSVYKDYGHIERVQ